MVGLAGFWIVAFLAAVVVVMICYLELSLNAERKEAAAEGTASTADTIVLDSASGGSQGRAKWGDALSDASDMMSSLEDSDAELELAEPKAIRTSGVVAAKKKTAAKKKPAKKKAAKKKAPAKKKAAKKPAAKKKSPTKKKAAAKKKPTAKKK